MTQESRTVRRMPSHQHHQHGHSPDREADEAALAELLDLDAEVLHSYLAEVITWVGELAASLPRRRILDLGSGTGAGTLALARQFAGADLIAVDVSAPLLGRLQARARELGADRRIRILRADLDAGWPDTGPLDLVWASNSLHHLADPDRVLDEVFAALGPGGLLAVAEMDSFPRFLPEDIGPGLEERAHAALAESLAGDVPQLGSDWAPRLRKAGFSVEAERTFAINLASPLPAAACRYAQASLSRIRSGLAAGSAPPTRLRSARFSTAAGPAASCGATTSPSAPRGRPGWPDGHEAAAKAGPVSCRGASRSCWPGGPPRRGCGRRSCRSQRTGGCAPSPRTGAAPRRCPQLCPRPRQRAAHRSPGG